jgi:pimeloyl-ACP methyl ester carboxylesterase
MRTFEQGEGPPLVFVPGFQGGWEYHGRTIESLSRGFRVITFALAGERASGATFDAARGLDNYVDQIRFALDERRLDAAIVCGVSFGALPVIRFAGAEPARVRSVVLVSPPPPRWRLARRHQFYLRMPWLFGPIFMAETPFRLRAELASAFPDGHERKEFVHTQWKAIRRLRLSLSQMAIRARLLSGDSSIDAGRITAPTLIVTGERGLDYVVPPDGSIEYTRLIAGARHVVIPRTGHIGSITRPDVFAALVRDFVEGHHHAAA